MTRGSYQDNPMTIRATRVRPVFIIVPLLLLVLGAGASAWYLWPRPQAIQQNRNGYDTAAWPSWLKQSIAYTPAEEPKGMPEPEQPDPHAEMMRQLLEQQKALRRELEALKNKPATTQEGQKPQRKHSPMLFLEHEPPEEDGDGPHTYSLAPGATKIACQIETEMNSEVPGIFTAKVTAPVYDTETGRHLLIPQNSTILGTYDSDDLLYGAERLPTWSLTLTLPNGTDFEIGQTPVTDNLGVLGLTGDVDHHYFRNLAAVLITGVLRGGAVAVQQNALQAGAVGQVGSGIAGATSQYGQQAAGRAIDVRPTIRVFAGQLCNLILTKRLALAEYH